MLNQLNIQRLVENKRDLLSLEEGLESAHEESKIFTFFNEIDKLNSPITKGSKIGQDFISWKNEYFRLQSLSDDIVETLCLSLEECAFFFRDLHKGGVNKAIKQFNFGHTEQVMQCFIDEMAHSEKMNVIPFTCIELLKEIKERIAKINNVEIAVNNISKLSTKLSKKSDVINMSVMKEQDTSYPSLLNFINLSRMLPYLKYTITRDIFQSLSELHKRDVIYVFLSPQNVSISGGGAVLCDVDTASKNEPIPDFKFFSPEIDSSNSSKLSASHNFSTINLAADYYSLGRMIIWLSSKGLNENLLEHEMDVIKRFPFIGKLVSKEPKLRPSFFEFKRFMDILPDFYNTCDFSSPFIQEDSSVNVLENSFESGSDSSVQTMVPKILEEERNLIYKEMEDSDNGSENDDNCDGDEFDNNDNDSEDDNNDTDSKNDNCGNESEDDNSNNDSEDNNCNNDSEDDNSNNDSEDYDDDDDDRYNDSEDDNSNNDSEDYDDDNSAVNIQAHDDNNSEDNGETDGDEKNENSKDDDDNSEADIDDDNDDQCKDYDNRYNDDEDNDCEGSSEPNGHNNSNDRKDDDNDD